MKEHIDLTQGSIVGRMVGMAIPMLGGTFAMTAFNLADTWFVSLLGTTELAAMSFTFPIVIVMGSMAMALSMGTTVVVSQALGEGDRERAGRLVTDSMLLTFVLIQLLSLLSLSLMTPLLRLMNASPDVLPLSREYLLVYLLFAGLIFLATPTNGAMRAAGDTRRPSLVMISATVLNAALDPLLIFGWGAVPAMGLTGAAVATVASRLLAMVLSLWLLHHHYGLLAPPNLRPSVLLRSWREVLRIAGPTLVSLLLVPVSMFIITAIVGSYGQCAVAALGAGGRIEMFAYLLPMSLGISLAPLVGQNYGAGRYDRVEDCRRWSERLALSWGVVIAILCFALAPHLARIFAAGDPQTEYYLTLYLRIMPFGYGMREILRYLTITLNAISRPMASLKLNATYLALLTTPLAALGSWLLAMSGVFWGLMLGNNLAGIIALIYGRRVVTAKALRNTK